MTSLLRPSRRRGMWDSIPGRSSGTLLRVGAKAVRGEPSNVRRGILRGSTSPPAFAGRGQAAIDGPEGCDGCRGIIC